MGHFLRPVQESFSLPVDADPMSIAILEAMDGAGLTTPNPSVGCVIVKNGKVISVGATEKYKHRHAERVACDWAGEHNLDISGADFYVTLEPCAKFGNQPPCLDLLLSQKPNSVTIASLDPDLRTHQKAIQAFRAAGIETRASAFASEALFQNLPFMVSNLKQRPYWFAKWAESADGHWSDPKTDPAEKQKWITKPKARAWSHALRQRSDAIVVGAQTFLQDRPSLTVRDCTGAKERHPSRIVVDPKSRLLNAPAELVWPEESASPWIWLLPKKDLEVAKLKIHANKNVQVHVLDPDAIAQTIECLPWIEIQGRTLQSVMVEGGRGLFNLFRSQNQVFDVLYQWVGATTFGHSAALPTASGPKTDTSGYELLAHNEIDGDQLFEWIEKSLKYGLFNLQFKP